MAIIMSNIIWLIVVSVSYFTLFAFIPFWLRGYKLSGENVLDKLVNTFLYSNIIIILSVSALSLIGIYYKVTIVILFIVLAFAYRMFFRRTQTFEAFFHIKQCFFDLIDGYYHPRVLIRDIFSKFKLFLKSIIFKIKNPIGLIFTIGIFSYATYIRCYHSVVNMFYATSDMYLHTEWVKFFMHNKPYVSGVYPFGFHSVTAAVSTVFNINVVTVMQMLGPVIGILTVFVLYYVLRRTMHSTFALNVALALYVVSDLFPYWASERQFLALPQEFGMMFLYLTAYFLYQYMKNKKTSDLVSFSTCVSLTLLIHFFVTIYAVLISVPVFIACIVYLNWKVFLRLVLGVCIALVIAVLPLGAGLVQGIEFNGSMEWALSFFLESEVTEEIPTEETAKPTTILEIYEELKEQEFFDPSYHLSLLNLYWLIPYLSAAFVALLSPLFKWKQKGHQWIFMAFSLYSLLILLLFILSYFEIFAIMEYSRLYVFYIYSIPLVICIPFEFLYLLLCGSKKIAKVAYITIISAVSSAGIFYMGTNQRFMPLGRVWQSQYNGAVLTYYDIVKNFPKNQWLIISSMTEYSQCLFEGYHYEMSDFIIEMNDYNETSELNFPSENVFIYVVKRPNTYLDTDLQQLGEFETLPDFEENDVSIDLEKVFGAEKGSGINLYKNFEANRVLQAKAYSWAEEYRKYYPEEMTVYYEDDEIIVYRLKQNPYALNNFAIAYMGNVK